jgi:S-DNA-T family DNA segregation ATPase FtsK/SpoIIIE
MTTPNEHLEMVARSGPGADGEVIDLATARASRGLDQDAAAAPDDDGTLTGEVIDPPAPSSQDEHGERPARVVEHRRDGAPLTVLPEWATSPEVFAAAVRREAKFVVSWIGYHGVRLPLYVPRFLGRAAVGFGLCVRSVARWVTDAEHKADRTALLHGAKGTSEWASLRKTHSDGVRTRLGALGFAGASTGAGGMALYASAGPEVATAAALATGAAALTGFGIAGTKRVAAPIVPAHEGDVPKITMDVVTDALLTLGLGSMGEAKRGNAEVKVLRIFPTTGGVEIHIDLPPGATAADVIERKDRLAAALRRPEDCVWPEGNPKAHPSRLNLFIADKGLSERDAVRWKYRDKGATNIFEPFAIGEDQRGRPVSTCLMYNNGVVGGLPGMGKTFFLRVLILGAVLDPRTELHVHELKGTGDLLPFAPVAHVCRSGDDPEDMRALLADLKAVQDELRRRAKIIRSLPRDVCPESKVTDDLAAEGNPHGFKPLLFVIDESQLAFTDPDLGAEISALTEDITRRGRALGIMLWLATQRPNKDAIPTGISALLSLRACLRVGDVTTNDMVLGTSMYKAGHRATIFSQEDKGIALLAGETSDPQLVRGAFIDGTHADQIVERARAIREAKGLLTGMAAGDEPADLDHSTILDHLLAVWPEHDPEWTTGKVWSDVLADRLAEHKPALYEGWSAAQVNAAAKRHGVTAKNVKRPGTTDVARGLVRDDVAAAAREVLELPDPTETGKD